MCGDAPGNGRPAAQGHLQQVAPAPAHREGELRVGGVLATGADAHDLPAPAALHLNRRADLTGQGDRGGVVVAVEPDDLDQIVAARQVRHVRHRRQGRPAVAIQVVSGDVEPVRARIIHGYEVSAPGHRNDVRSRRAEQAALRLAGEHAPQFLLTVERYDQPGATVTRMSAEVDPEGSVLRVVHIQRQRTVQVRVIADTMKRRGDGQKQRRVGICGDADRLDGVRRFPAGHRPQRQVPARPRTVGPLHRELLRRDPRAGRHHQPAQAVGPVEVDPVGVRPEAPVVLQLKAGELLGHDGETGFISQQLHAGRDGAVYRVVFHERADRVAEGLSEEVLLAEVAFEGQREGVGHPRELRAGHLELQVHHDDAVWILGPFGHGDRLAAGHGDARLSVFEHGGGDRAPLVQLPGLELLVVVARLALGGLQPDMPRTHHLLPLVRRSRPQSLPVEGEIPIIAPHHCPIVLDGDIEGLDGRARQQHQKGYHPHVPITLHKYSRCLSEGLN